MKIKKTKKILITLIEIAIFIVLALIIIYLIKENKDIISKNKEQNAKDKLDKAIKVFTTSKNSTLEDSINNIEGATNLTVNKEAGTYTVELDGQKYTVVSKEIIFDENVVANEENK